jgi:hypothetical protein
MVKDALDGISSAVQSLFTILSPMVFLEHQLISKVAEAI